MTIEKKQKSVVKTKRYNKMYYSTIEGILIYIDAKDDNTTVGRWVLLHSKLEDSICEKFRTEYKEQLSELLTKTEVKELFDEFVKDNKIKTK